jgi:hypothetical protein
MAFKPVGICTAITISTTTATSSTFTQQSAYIRVVALTKSAHVTIGGTNPIATPANFFVHEGEPETLSVGRVDAQQVVGIETGSTTTVSFPEGIIGSPFVAGDSISLTVTGQSDYDISNALVKGITQTVVEPYQTKVELFHDSSSGAPDQTRDGLGSFAELRRTFRVAALGLGSGTLYVQQVQQTGGV